MCLDGCGDVFGGAEKRPVADDGFVCFFLFFLVLSGISTWRGGGGATKGSNALFSSYIRISVAVLPCGGDFITWYVYILFRESS